MKTHDFNKSIIIGTTGEEIIKEYLNKNKNITSIISVQDEFEYRKIDVDFIITFENKKETYIEVKTDTYDTGNIFFEIYSCLETGSIGCMIKSEAKFLFYYFILTNELYIFNMKKYKEWVFKNVDKFKIKALKNKRFNDETYTSLGYLIPKIMIESELSSYKKDYIA